MSDDEAKFIYLFFLSVAVKRTQRERECKTGKEEEYQSRNERKKSSVMRVFIVRIFVGESESCLEANFALGFLIGPGEGKQNNR